MLANTVSPISIHVGTWPDRGLRPLSISFVPFDGYGFEDALIDVAVFVPLRVLVPLLIKRRTWWRVVAIVDGTIGYGLFRLTARSTSISGFVRQFRGPAR